jgi:hypothetical protein
MPTAPIFVDLEDTVIAVYAAVDDALQEGGVVAHDGKLLPRPGPEPEVDDREVLCLALLQELFGFESDNKFWAWVQVNRTMRSLFPRLLTRQNFADRRALLLPILEPINQRFCALCGEAEPPFSLLTAIP